MDTNDHSHKTPGQLITSLLESRGWTKRATAAILGVSEPALSKMASDKQAVTADFAVALEDVFSVPAEEFLRLQQGYDLAKARYAAPPNPKRAARARLLSELPIHEMISRNWLSVQSEKDIDDVENQLVKFFGQSDISAISDLPYAFKKTDQDAPISLAQLAWLYRVQNIARELLVPSSFTGHKAKDAISKLKLLLAAPEEARHAPRILNEAGIRFLIVEGLKGGKIDGVCFWLNDYSPVIAMTLRHDRMDNFWFVLRHELEHVNLGHGKVTPIVDSDIESGEGADSMSSEELAANAAASEFCASPARVDSFIARKAPLFPERDFLGLANILGVHPSLVAGQIRFKTKRYELFTKHMAKIRTCVLPSAIVDGWGDIAPVGN